jgi:hypothetical protein
LLRIGAYPQERRTAPDRSKAAAEPTATLRLGGMAPRQANPERARDIVSDWPIARDLSRVGASDEIQRGNHLATDHRHVADVDAYCETHDKLAQRCHKARHAFIVITRRRLDYAKQHAVYEQRRRERLERDRPLARARGLI